MSAENPYQSVGTLQGVSYIVREADEKLQKAILNNRQFPYFLAARQSGKSSILTRTQSTLEAPGLHFAILDLSKFDPISLGSYDKFVNTFVSEIISAIGGDEALRSKIKRARKEPLFFWSPSGFSYRTLEAV